MKKVIRFETERKIEGFQENMRSGDYDFRDESKSMEQINEEIVDEVNQFCSRVCDILQNTTDVDAHFIQDIIYCAHYTLSMQLLEEDPFE